MNWKIDPPLRFGDISIYGLADCSRTASMSGGRLSGYGSKVPALILVVTGDVVTGIDLAGHPVPKTDIEREYPGALDSITP